MRDPRQGGGGSLHGEGPRVGGALDHEQPGEPRVGTGKQRRSEQGMAAMGIEEQSVVNSIDERT
jgi:hypothetical protein